MGDGLIEEWLQHRDHLSKPIGNLNSKRLGERLIRQQQEDPPPGIGPAFQFDLRTKLVFDLDDVLIEEPDQCFGGLWSVLEMQTDFDVLIPAIGPDLVMEFVVPVVEFHLPVVGLESDSLQITG